MGLEVSQMRSWCTRGGICCSRRKCGLERSNASGNLPVCVVVSGVLRSAVAALTHTVSLMRAERQWSLNQRARHLLVASVEHSCEHTHCSINPQACTQAISRMLFLATLQLRRLPLFSNSSDVAWGWQCIEGCIVGLSFVQAVPPCFTLPTAL